MGSGEPPEQLPASPSGSLCSRGAHCLQHSAFGGGISCGISQDPVPRAGFHLPPHLGHARTHTYMCLSRMHACGTHGIYGAQQRELDRTVTWVTGILLGPFLEPQPSQSLFLLAKLARSHQRAISRFIVRQPLGQATPTKLVAFPPLSDGRGGGQLNHFPTLPMALGLPQANGVGGSIPPATGTVLLQS